MLVGNDLVITDDLQFVAGIDGVAQLCRIAVQMFAGEWFADLDQGIRYWDAILGNSPELARTVALSEFRDTLLTVPGVLAVTRLEVKFSDAGRRTLTVTWQVRTASGDTPADTLTTSGLGV